MNPRLLGCLFWILAVLILTLLLVWIYPLQPTPAAEPTPTAALVITVLPTSVMAPVAPTATSTEVPERILETPTSTPLPTLGATATPSSTVTPNGPVEERPNNANPTPEGTPIQRG